MAFNTGGDAEAVDGPCTPCLPNTRMRQRKRPSSDATPPDSHQGEQPDDVPGELRVSRNRAHDQPSVDRLVGDLTGDKSWIEIENPPASRDAIHGHAVVHLAGVHHDHVASLGFDLTDYAPRPLRAGRHDPDAKLIMGMARKGVVGKQGHRLDARNSRSMLLHAMHPIDHDCPHVLRSAGSKAVMAEAVDPLPRMYCRH